MLQLRELQGPPVTLLFHYGHLISGCRGGITGQGQLNAVPEDFHASLCLGLGCDEQKERQAGCARRDGSRSAGTAVSELGGRLWPPRS